MTEHRGSERPEPSREPSPETGAADAAPLVEAPSAWKPLVLLLVVALCVAAVTLTPLREHLGPEAVQEWRAGLDALGAWGVPAFFGATAIAVSLGVPRLLLSALAGALFGWVAGAGISHCATVVGAWMTFATGRALGRDYVGGVVRRRIPRADRILGFVGRHGILATALLRAAPVGHSFTTSLLLSVSPIPTADFLLGTFLGSLPYTVVFALFGSAAGGQQGAGRIGGGMVGLLLISLALGWWVRRVLARERAERKADRGAG